MSNDWGLKECLFFILAIAFALFVAVFLYNQSIGDLFSNDNKSVDEYKQTEEDLVSVAKIYVENYYYKVLEPGDEDHITVRGLQEEGLITEVVDAKKEHIKCSGYVIFKNKEGITYYDPYIKCKDSYQTKGYNEKYDLKIK